jgi:desulfoferrodoxin (superoxide reductase-like protein)
MIGVALAMLPGMRRRAFLQLSFVAATMCACSARGTPPEDDWEDRAGGLEDAQGEPFTAAEPGPWRGEEQSHVPVLTVSSTVRVDVMHTQVLGDPAGLDHFVTAVYVRDQDGHIIHFIELGGDEPSVLTSFIPPEGTTEIIAYAHCNVHGLWRSGTTVL